MFGTFRLVLAGLVIWDHFYGAHFSGSMAVFGFYCLSGYLMTAIINGPYADGLAGFLRYLGNRALRIYPAYFAVAGLVALGILSWPAFARLHPAEIFDPAFLLPSLTIIGLAPLEPTFIGPAWTLHVELLHYVAIGALLGRSRLATVLWFTFALVLRLGGPLGGFPLEWFYWTPIGATLPFAAGAMLWHFRAALPRSNAVLASIVAGLFVALAGMMTVPHGLAWGLLAGLLLCAAAIALLRDIRPTPLDRLAGDLAYPLYLLHMPAAEAVAAFFGHYDLVTDTLAVILSLGLCMLSIVVVERPLLRLRSQLRQSVPARQPA